MKTILWATLSANGNYARASAAHPPKPEATADFAAQAVAAGNFIVGRNTFEAFRAQPSRAGTPQGPTSNPFASTTIVVVSTAHEVIPGVQRASTPEAALALVRAAGHSSALIAGGAQLHNAFLERDLVDELIFDIAPALEDQGLKLHLPRGAYGELELLACKPLGGGLVQLHYARKRG
jgi:dihydrofolate reductase